jgi:ATP-dependent DNA helicase 2 subunit 2
MQSGITGTCAFALQETSRPDIKQTKSTLVGSVLRLGDVEARPNEAVEILVKYSKCTALARPKSWKRFGNAGAVDEDEMAVDTKVKKENGSPGEPDIQWRQLAMRTEYYVGNDDDVKGEDEQDVDTAPVREQVDKDSLVKGFKYGASYVPCPEGQFPKMATVKGIDICGFFHAKNVSFLLVQRCIQLTWTHSQFKRDQAMGEVYYVWADPGAVQQQIAMSSVVQAMYEKNVMAIARWVNRDDADPKMGVLAPCVFESVDCFLWTQVSGDPKIQARALMSYRCHLQTMSASTHSHP